MTENKEPMAEKNRPSVRADSFPETGGMQQKVSPAKFGSEKTSVKPKKGEIDKIGKTTVVPSSGIEDTSSTLLSERLPRKEEKSQACVVYFNNKSHDLVKVTTLSYEPYRCNGKGEWLVQGWTYIEPGDTMYTVSSLSRYFYFYAEAIDGVPFWTGDATHAYISESNFIRCWYDYEGLPIYTGMDEVDVDNYDEFTVRLIL